LKAKTKKSGNKYFVMRHGQAQNNVGDTYHKNPDHDAHLTEEGRNQILKNLKNINHKIDVVISSPLNRTKETTRIVCEHIGFPKDKVVYDKRMQEWETSSTFEGQSKLLFNKYYDVDCLKNPNEALPDSESLVQLIKRVGDFIYDVEKKYSGKNILIISHEGATRAFDFVVKGASLNLLKNLSELVSLNNAEVEKFDFVPLPHNENYELDLHRPYIDEVSLVCAHSTSSGQVCGGNLIRTKEVMDVWFDSGAMPFAQDHYPFDFTQGKPFANKEILYPADYISEAIDQTRGWFYTLHAVGILMGRGKAYKNVICLGHLLDANGKKMSKSIGNIVDPWAAMDKYGVDTLRLWMYSVNQPGESKNFDEKTVALLQGQVLTLLYNVLAFYELYRDKDLERGKALPFGEGLGRVNILDQWILFNLLGLRNLVTGSMDSYKLLEPVRAIRKFIDDLSTWYLRRSRERIKEQDADAKRSLYYVLKTLAKLMAPFAPFSAEDIWQKLKNEKDEESVHLARWPEEKSKLKILFNLPSIAKIGVYMDETRRIVTLGLEARQRAKIQVRQPLARLEVRGYNLNSEYSELIKSELNVKEIVSAKNIDQDVVLNTEITPELKLEGEYRELVRALQDMRKNMGLTPNDLVTFVFDAGDMVKGLVEKFEGEMKKTILASKIEFKTNDGVELKVGKFSLKVKIQK